MSVSALANVVTQALSIAQLCSAVWRTMEEAESALRAFSAAQGWSLSTRNSDKYHYKLRDGQGRSGLVSWSCEKCGAAPEDITDKQTTHISVPTLLQQKRSQQVQLLNLPSAI
jgi:hypothetical protein